MVEGQPKLVKGRKVAILVAAGSDTGEVTAMKSAVKAKGVHSEIVGPHLGVITKGIEAKKTYGNSSSVLFAAGFIPGGADAIGALEAMPDAIRFVAEAFNTVRRLRRVARAARSSKPLASCLTKSRASWRPRPPKRWPRNSWPQSPSTASQSVSLSTFSPDLLSRPLVA